jgi:adenosine deaminase
VTPLNWIKEIPKVDLHLHLDGAARPDTLMDLMRNSGMRMPTEDPIEFRKLVQVPRGCRSLADFLKAFEFFYPVLKSAVAVERLAYELSEDCAKQNVRCFEARFAPALQAAPGFSQEDVVQAAIRGIERGRTEFKVRAGLILCIYRSITEHENMEAVRLAAKYLGKGVVGVDLAGDEGRYPATMYAGCFKKAAELGVPINCHAGDGAGPKSIKDALDLGAKRIGHGVRLQEDPAVFERVRREGVPLEICVTSNVQTQAVKGYASHPAKRYLEEGIRVTLNTDDPGVSAVDMNHEIEVAVEKLGFSPAQIRQAVLNGVDSLFLPAADKAAIRQDYEKELSAKLPAAA